MFTTNDYIPYEGNEHLVKTIAQGGMRFKEIKKRIRNVIECITNEFPVGSLVYIEMSYGAALYVMNEPYVRFSPELFNSEYAARIVHGAVVSRHCWYRQSDGRIWGYNPLGINVLVNGEKKFMSSMSLVTIKNYGIHL